MHVYSVYLLEYDDVDITKQSEIYRSGCLGSNPYFVLPFIVGGLPREHSQPLQSVESVLAVEIMVHGYDPRYILWLLLNFDNLQNIFQ